MKVFSESNFPLHGQSPGHLRKLHIRENLYVRIFLYISFISPETYTLLKKNNRHHIENN